MSDCSLHIFTTEKKMKGIHKSDKNRVNNIDGKSKGVLIGMTSLDHITVSKLLRLRTLTSNFSGDRYFCTFCARFHDETENTVARTAHSQSAD